MKKLGLSLIISMSTLNADCWFNCDNISRNISTDTAKIYKLIKETGHSKKKTSDGTTYFCGRNDEHELRTISVKKDINNELLVINFSQYSPPKYGSTSWDFMEVDTGLSLRFAKVLSFGLVGIAEQISEDYNVPSKNNQTKKYFYS